MNELTVFINVNIDSLKASSLFIPEIVNINDKIDKDKIKMPGRVFYRLCNEESKEKHLSSLYYMTKTKHKDDIFFDYLSFYSRQFLDNNVSLIHPISPPMLALLAILYLEAAVLKSFNLIKFNISGLIM